MIRKRKPRILLTNDDGISAAGIQALYKAVKGIGDVTIVAPDSERSAVGHAITLSDPLRVNQLDKNIYSTTGTPADCVKLAVRAILKQKPDLVISGINLGPNTGFSVLYSGTVSGATEGVILGIPSMAISLGTFTKPDYTFAAQFARKIALMVIKKGLPKGILLNVNVPAVVKSKVKGVKITRQSKRAFIEKFDKRTDPHGRIYYWLSGEVIDLEGEQDSDIDAINQGYVSITPLHCDMTEYAMMEQIKEWYKSK
ncbi:5'/3'-nucleotidase SurE [candidate division WOR-1 bacterium RIFCSPHIGHO2_01_FULL_53_15]|uniref:5'-nucleotidase SurE n=1 Tax=candidate division WOR-1 bacterium RIFCSPHIGHO2_01_FULL_53_15 TaxID=1802564 RepID=A0A1F4Q095_UNCSA|nr:MAG: 5'/3'-nucleotidase SurE [candidate division WOR-1 bacterium RIFCSPHIGHO2_01_FULL_53_15]OGC12929.1 MAG: 5'/3'-nucleotidase SurE [candidate division WOR-1 bacterium RIFCSPHIGHO2_02_FULL_53_26]